MSLPVVAYKEENAGDDDIIVGNSFSVITNREDTASNLSTIQNKALSKNEKFRKALIAAGSFGGLSALLVLTISGLLIYYIVLMFKQPNVAKYLKTPPPTASKPALKPANIKR